MVSRSLSTHPTGAIEILGPAGSGKSTLLTALCSSIPNVRPLSIYATPRNLPLWLLSACKLLTQLRTPASYEASPWRKGRWMIRLEAAEKILGREAARSPALFLFDQGPLYTLAHLRWALRSSLSSLDPRVLWERCVPFWAETLEAIVVLEASDEVLLDRIRTRSKSHSLREAARDKARRRLAEERSLYEALIDELVGARPALPVLRYDTTVQSTSAIVASLVDFLKGRSSIGAEEAEPGNGKAPTISGNQSSAGGGG